MPLASAAASALSPAKSGADNERRAQIVTAAQRAFVRFGFHATTMQNVAEEAGMSAGNLYRYFPSKEAIVEELCAFEHAERVEIFTTIAKGGDLREAIAGSLREHVFARPPEKARMIMEIWAEAGRNPRVAAITRAVDDDVLAGLERVMTAAKLAGGAAASLDPAFAAKVMFTFVAGLFKRLALESSIDREAEAAMAMGILGSLFSGALAPAEGI
jgi:AcrR family transcriptional regulator